MPEPAVAPAVDPNPAPAAAAPAPVPAAAAAPDAVPATAPVSNVTWPDQWREGYAKGDDKKLARLSRYASPEAAIDALLSVQNRISAGEIKNATPFPDKGTAEQQTQWRTEHGIPEAADKYDLKFDDGLVIGENDKPSIDAFLQAAHKANMEPSQVKEAVRWYFDNETKQAEARETLDKTVAQQTVDALNAEWGQDFRRNMNLIDGLLATAPTGVKDKIMGGRLADGTPMASDPDVIRALANWAREINPVTTLVPNAGANVASAIDDEINKIETRMKTDRKGYNKDEAQQARYRELLDAKARAARK